jgi:transposase
VHRLKHVATVLIEREDGGTDQYTREFGGFRRDLRWLVAWLQRYEVELVVESTGIYWKSRYAHLERAGIEAWVVNAHHIKQVPGRKTDIGDAHWLAELGRFGLVHRLASWAALCPGNQESAAKRQSGKTRKGNSLLRYLLCEAANAARRTKSVFAYKYQGLAIRMGHKKAIVALAHQLIRTIYVILTRREPYRDSGIYTQAAAVSKNAPRWIRALKGHPLRSGP